jgi:hypothetical protein
MGCVLVDGAPACVVQCSEGFADCDGELATGCEVPVSDPARSYYVDADGDGYGAGDPVFFCSAAEVPATGYASRPGDCNDGEASINPDAADDCDGIDNDCDGGTDGAATGVGGSCETGEHGVCAVGTLQCVDGSRQCVRSQQPAAESCNGLDDDCDGAVDDELVGVDDPCTYAAAPGLCSEGRMRCNVSAQRIECTQTFVPTEDLPDELGKDSNCDGIDGDESIAVFVDWRGSDTSAGTKDAPLRTVSAGIAKAQELGKSHVYIAVGEYVEEANLELANGVSLFGGFAPNSWSRAAAEEATHITRAVAQTDNEPNVSGVDARDITAATTLQDLAFSIQTPTAPGGSTYGLRCNTCTSLKVTRARFDVGNGANGMTGADVAGGPEGVMGAEDRTGGFSPCGTSGGEGGLAFNPGRLGSPANLGGAGGAPSFSPPAGNGGAGRRCENEAQGGAGGILAPVLGLDASGFPRLEPSTSSRGARGCDSGGGGGGGGLYNGLNIASGAGGSSGGCGGAGGNGGGSGGSSVGAALVSSSGIHFEGVNLKAGSGGKGGVGGTGGRGGNGVGGRGAAGDGGDGGAGANGAGGGGGGGGVGGSAYGIVRDQGTALTGSGYVPTHGLKGAGGAGGAGGQGGTFGTDPGLAGIEGAHGQDGEELDDKSL